MKTKHKIGGKPLSARYMKSYIAKNMVRLTRKMKRAKDAGWYMGSQNLMSANSTLRYMYRKYGLDPDNYHTGKNFLDNIKSWNEIKAMYNALQKVEQASSYAAKSRLKRYEKEFSEMMEKAKQEAIERGERVTPKMYNTSYSDRFALLSDLSMEFHEIFAFMTYNEVETAIAEGNNTVELLLQKYYNKIKDWDMTNDPRTKHKFMMAIKTETYVNKKYKGTNRSRMLNKIKGGI